MDQQSSPDPTQIPPQFPTRAIRWWPLILFAALGGGVVAWIWGFQDKQRQDKNLQTILVFLLFLALANLWCLAFSRMRWRMRGLLVGGCVAAVASMAFFFRIRGVTGDFLPVLEWRWQTAAMPGGSLSPSPVRNSLEFTGRSEVKSLADYPQFLGPDRNTVLPGPELAPDWKERPPERIWRQPIGPAWSGFACRGRRAITQEQQGENEAVVCFELLSGKRIWTYTYPARYYTKIAGEGPRATPTIAGERVFAQGATGVLTCLRLEDGGLEWSKNVVEENQSETLMWGNSGSPLVVERLVVLNPGGKQDRSLVAYRVEDGQFAWGGGHDRASFSSPCLATFAGQRQIVIVNAASIAGHDLSNGRLLWEYPWPDKNPNVAAPVTMPRDQVLVSSGYGVGSALLQIKQGSSDQWTASRLWHSKRLKAKFTNLAFRDGYLYGLDDGILACLELATGDQKWKEGRYGHGQVILVGSLLLIMAENGEVVLVEPNPSGSRELGRFTALGSKTWNPPALAGPYLIVRNDLEAAVYRLPLAAGANSNERSR